jgi:hypothetical protein
MPNRKIPFGYASRCGAQAKPHKSGRVYAVSVERSESELVEYEELICFI